MHFETGPRVTELSKVTQLITSLSVSPFPENSDGDTYVRVGEGWDVIMSDTQAPGILPKAEDQTGFRIL